MKFRVAVDETTLDSAPIVEADGPAVAAAQYIAENGMAAGTYWVQEIQDAQEVTVTITKSTTAKLEHVGGVPAEFTIVEGGVVDGAAN